MKKMIDEVSRSVKLLGDRCSKLEASPCMVAKPATSFQQSAGNKESIRLQTRLVQQRRQDLQHAQANFREVEARFNDLDQKEHLEDRLSELVEVVQTQPGDQVTQLVVRGLEERFANLRADVSREVATVVRESKENWVVASRRLAALEAWPASQAELSASMHSLRSEHQEDRGRLEILSREAEGLGRQVVHIRRELSLGRPEIAEEGLTGAPFWIQLGLFGGAEPKKIAVKSAAKMAVLVAGIFCRLKFFPDGSPLRQTDGSCSLYLVCTVPNVNVRFRLFAGNRYSPVLEANTARGGRDQGRHDLCLLKDVLNEDGSVVVGAEILEANGEVVEFTADSRVVLKTSGTECAQYNLCQVRSV
ncbi:Trophinin [Durusdinium trenchii]|uniref:Trophinin n=1 Tax=Durusdinium trenchii TaxID=1381693 RepID=A0ABP0Q7G4_9DINO